MTDHLTTPDGRRLELLTGGADDGFPLLFHGGTPCAAVRCEPLWRAAADAGLRLVTYSRPGYGASTPWPEGAAPTMASDASDSATVLDALGVDEFVTLGWSGGGPRALACAALLPERCRGAISLAGVAPSGAPGLDWTAGMGAENVHEFELAARGREAFRAFAEEEHAEMAALTADQVVSLLGGLVDDVDADALNGGLADYVAASFRHAVSRGVAGRVEDNLQLMRPWGFDVHDIAGPVALWHGAHDRMVPLSHGRWLGSRIPGAQVRFSDTEGHVSLLLRLPEILADLRELADLGRPGS